MIEKIIETIGRTRAIYYLSRILSRDADWVLKHDMKNWERVKMAIKKGLYGKEKN